MQVLSQTYPAYVSAESNTPKPAFSEVHGARLLCWSAAIFSVSLWMASLFFDAQLNNFNAARIKQDRAAEMRLSSPVEWQRTIARIAARKAAQDAALQYQGNLAATSTRPAVR